MTKYKVRVDTKSDITGIMGVIDKSDGDVFLLNQANEDGTEFRVNAKSLLGFTRHCASGRRSGLSATVVV